MGLPTWQFTGTNLLVSPLAQVANLRQSGAYSRASLRLVQEEKIDRLICFAVSFYGLHIFLKRFFNEPFHEGIHQLG